MVYHRYDKALTARIRARMETHRPPKWRRELTFWLTLLIVGLVFLLIFGLLNRWAGTGTV